jgi:uncharacterized membrane protein
MAPSFAHRLRDEAQHWVREGLVSAQQAEAILARYPASAAWFTRPIAIFSVLGGVLLVCAAALIVAHNWQEIPRWGKLGGVAALMLAAHAGGLGLRARGGEKLAGGLFVLGGGLLLVGIGLVGQLYNLSGRQSDAILLWWVLLVSAGYALPSVALVVLGWLGACAWYVTLLFDRTTWLGRDVQSDARLALVAIAAGGLLAWALGVLHGDGEYRRVRQCFEQVGLCAAGVALVPLGLFGSHVWSVDSLMSRWPTAILSVLAVATVMLVVTPSRLPRDRFTARAGPAAALLLVVLFCVGVVVALQAHASAAVFRRLDWTDWALLFVVGVAFILYGARWDRTSWINWGLIWIGADAVARYFELFGSLLQTSALFFATGIFVLLLGWVLERLRRRMVARAATLQRAR